MAVGVVPYLRERHSASLEIDIYTTKSHAVVLSNSVCRFSTACITSLLPPQPTATQSQTFLALLLPGGSPSCTQTLPFSQSPILKPKLAAP